MLDFCIEKRLVKCAIKIIVLNQFMNLVTVVNLSTIEVSVHKQLSVSSIELLYKTQTQLTNET